jgi:hypothetical protein
VRGRTAGAARGLLLVDLAAPFLDEFLGEALDVRVRVCAELSDGEAGLAFLQVDLCEACNNQTKPNVGRTRRSDSVITASVLSAWRIPTRSWKRRQRHELDGATLADLFRTASFVAAVSFFTSDCSSAGVAISRV